MSRKIRARLLSLILLLGVVTGVLATPDSQSAQAMMCCETCLFIYDQCMAAPSQGPCYGNSLCCSGQADPCMQTCFWC